MYIPSSSAKTCPIHLNPTGYTEDGQPIYNVTMIGVHTLDLQIRTAEEYYTRNQHRRESPPTDNVPHCVAPPPIELAKIASAGILTEEGLPTMVGIRQYTNLTMGDHPTQGRLVHVPVPPGNEILIDNRSNHIGIIRPQPGDEQMLPGRNHALPSTAYAFSYFQTRTASFTMNAIWGGFCVPPMTKLPVFKYVGFDCAMSAHPDYATCYHQVVRPYTSFGKSEYDLNHEVRGADGERMFAKCMDPNFNVSMLDKIIRDHTNTYVTIDTSEMSDEPPKLSNLVLTRHNDYRGDFMLTHNRTMVEVKFVKSLAYFLEANFTRFVCTLYDDISKPPAERAAFGIFCSCDQNVFTQLLFGLKPILVTNLYRMSGAICELIDHHQFKDIYELACEATDIATIAEGTNVADGDTNTIAEGTADGQADELRQHALRCINDVCKEFLIRYEEPEKVGFILGGNLMYAGDPRRTDTSDPENEDPRSAHQYIGIVGYEVEDLKCYISDLMAITFVPVDGSNATSRMRAYNMGIRLIIHRTEKDDDPLVIEQHFDVSVLHLPPRWLGDYDLMFLINNCAWSSMHDICINIVRNQFHAKRATCYAAHFKRNTGEYIDTPAEKRNKSNQHGGICNRLCTCLHNVVAPALMKHFIPFVDEHAAMVLRIACNAEYDKHYAHLATILRQ